MDGKKIVDISGLAHYHSIISSVINSKQGTISDLESIRLGASKGETALQAIPSEYITETILNNKGFITSLKTINGESLIGEGNVIVGNKPLNLFTTASVELEPNSYYRNPNPITSLFVSLKSELEQNILNEYFIEFTTAATGATIAFPNTIKWANGQTPTFESNATYQISIVNNLGVCLKFA